MPNKNKPRTKKLSCKKARAFRAEEKNTAKEYASYGFKSLGKQEGKHNRVFDDYIKKNCR
jgi:hypothetical protein